MCTNARMCAHARMCNIFAHCCVHAGVVGSSVFTTWIIKQNADNLSEITSGMHLSKKITVFFRCFLTEITGMLHVFPVTVQNKFFCKNTLFDFCFRYCYIVYCTVYLYTVHCTVYVLCSVHKYPCVEEKELVSIGL